MPRHGPKILRLAMARIYETASSKKRSFFGGIFMRGMAQRLTGFIFCMSILSTAWAIDALEFQQWIAIEQQRSIQNLFKNVSREGTSPGSVIASPSRANPDYYYHWVRDSAIVMDTLVEFAKRTRFVGPRVKAMQALNSYAAFSRRNQLTSNRSGPGIPEDLSGTGEPKFHVDGRAYEGDWGRPQSDGPALRAIALIKFARLLLQQGREDYVREFLYDGMIPSNTVIKTDLDYVSRYWKFKSFDLWEEVGGDHFYTRMVQRKAMLDGARFAEDMRDQESQKWYSGQAQAISAELLRHWNPSNGRIYETIRPTTETNKESGLDAAVILGSLHGNTSDGFFSPTDDRILSTAVQLKTRFKELYAINQVETIPGVAIGRYPEDAYNGSAERNFGNPWFLCTLAFAELLYKAEGDFKNQGQIRITIYNKIFFEDLLPNESFDVGSTIALGEELFDRVLTALRESADSYILRVAYHLNRETGAMAEQFNRQTGFMQSAENLTWNYSAFLTATWARPLSADYIEQLKSLGIY
jgi:glucoamylase